MKFNHQRRALITTVFGLLLGLSLPAGADTAADGGHPTEAVLGFDRLVAFAAPLCRAKPAESCLDLVFDFADENGDQGLSLAELRRARDALEGWTSWRHARLAREERAGIALGLAVVDALGLETVLASYDRNEDGRLDLGELLADVQLDERPIREVLLDPAAVDRAAVARRLGSLAPLLDPALP